MRKPILCLDFDGVIHSYDSGWKGANIIPDPPVDGALQFISDAVKHFDVQIFSSRTHQNDGVAAMKNWLIKHWAEAFHVHEEFATYFVRDNIKFPSVKPPAMVTINDRALTFTGEWPSLETLQNFTPWNKKEPAND
jgi:hypothetical protein